MPVMTALLINIGTVNARRQTRFRLHNLASSSKPMLLGVVTTHHGRDASGKKANSYDEKGNRIRERRVG